MNTLTWPDNLWSAINEFWDKQVDEKEQETHVLYYPNLDEVLSTSLTEHQQELIRLRYEQGLTYAAIAENYNVGTERTRQKIQYALRILREPRNYNRLNAVPQVDVVRMRIKFDDLAQKHDELEKQYADLYNELEKKRAESRFRIPLDASLYELNLSTRSHNALIMNNVKTVGDLINCSISKLKKFRNLGETSLENIINALAEYDIILKP